MTRLIDMKNKNHDKNENYDGTEKFHMVAMIAGFTVLLLAMFAASATAADIDWTGSTHAVIGLEEYENVTIDADAINVQGTGTLRLTNVTLSITSGYSIDVYGTMDVMDYDNDNDTTGDRSIVQGISSAKFVFRVWSSANFLFENSELSDCGLAGPTVNSGLYIASTNATVSYNYIGAAYYGIYITTNAIANVDNNTIDDPSIMGIYATGAQVSITDNTIFSSGSVSIALVSSTIVVDGNDISYSSSTGIVMSSSTGTATSNNINNVSGHGIDVDNNSDLVIDNNMVDNVNTYGINARYSDVIISNNTINASNSYSMYLYYLYSGGEITDNIITLPRYSGSMIYVYTCQELLIDGNDMDGARAFGGYASSAIEVRPNSGGKATEISNNTIKNIYRGMYYYDRSSWKYDGLRIEDNTITDVMSNEAIYIEIAYYEGTINVNRNTIKQENGNYGIFVVYYQLQNFELSFQNNTIEQTNSWAVYLRNDHSSYRSDLYFRHNTIKDSRYGFYTRWNQRAYLDNNTVTNTTYQAFQIYETYGDLFFNDNIIDYTWYDHGLYIYYAYGNMQFHNNFINNSGYTGVYIRYLYYDFTSSNNVITNNKGYGMDIYYYYGDVELNKDDISDNQQYGFYLQGVGNSNNHLRITDTDINDNGYSGIYSYYMEYVYIENIEVRDNNGNGAYFYGSYYGLEVRNSTFNDNNGQGLYHDYWGNNYNDFIVENSVMVGNQGSGIYFYMYRNYGPITFKNLDIKENNNNGIYFYLRYQQGDITFENLNVLDNNGYGFYMYQYYQYEPIYIGNVTFNGNGNNGVYLRTYYYSYQETIVRNSQFNENGGHGFYRWVRNTYNDGSFTVVDSEFDKNNDNGFYWYNNWNSNFFVTYTNCSMSENNYGLQIQNTGVVITGTNIQNNSNSGLYLYGGGYVKSIIENNIFYDNSQGVYNYAYSSSSGSSISNNEFIGNSIGLNHQTDNQAWIVKNNIFKRGNIGIYNDEGTLNIENNTFKFLSYGVEYDYGSGLIIGNDFTNIWNFGIYIEDGVSLTIKDNTIMYSNTGIYVYESMVNFENNDLTGNAVGIFVYQSFIFMQGDHLADNEVGINISAFSFATMEDLIVENNLDFGIKSNAQTFMSFDVNNEARIINNAVELAGPVNVNDGATLTVTGSKVIMNSPGGAGYIISVNSGGKLVTEDSMFLAANSTKEFGLIAYPGSSLDLMNTDFKDVGFGTGPMASGIYIAGDAILDHVTITDSYSGLYITGDVDITMRNSSISNSENLDIYIEDDSILRTGNTDFIRNKVDVKDTSMIILERIIYVFAMDDPRDPYQGVNVTVTSEGSTIASTVTDTIGEWWNFFEGAIISNEGFSETLNTYTIELDDGVQQFNDTFILSDDYMETFEFGIAPTVLDGPTPLTVEEDTILEVDLDDYFQDNDDMVFTIEGNVSLTVTIEDNMATFLGAQDWYGLETVTMVATDSHGLVSTFELTIEVTPVNDVPVISGLSDLILNEDEDHVLDVMSYIYDPDTPQTGLTVTVDTMYGTVDGTRLTFNYPIVTIEFVRITVKDVEGGTSQDILVSVIGVNDAPTLTGMPVFDAIEDVEKVIDLGPYLFDEDTNTSKVFITSDALEVVMINGHVVTFLFPQGEQMRTVALNLSDGKTNNFVDVQFNVTPVNDPPELAELPQITVIEESHFIFDLTQYVSDPDNELSQLTVTVDNTDITTDGLLLIIYIQDAGSLLTVTVTVSDGQLDDSSDLRIVVTPVNDAPKLSDGGVNKKEGTTDDKFTFTVTLTDPDAENPAVYVVIDGKSYLMKPSDGEFNGQGQYVFKTKLDPGAHSFRFEVDDQSGDDNNKGSTEEFTALEVSEPMNWIPFLVLILILAAIAFILMAGRSKKKSDPVPIDDFEDVEEEETPFTRMDEEALDEEEEEEVEVEEEDDEAEEDVEEIDEEEETHLETKDSSGDLDATDAEADDVEEVDEDEDLDEEEEEEDDHDASLSEKASEGELDEGETSLEDLMQDIMKKK